MRTIKLYITCSDELTLDKNVIGNLVRQLNHVNNPKGISIELWDCEDYDLSDAVQSDMFVALFHKVIAAEWMYHPYHFEMYQS